MLGNIRSACAEAFAFITYKYGLKGNKDDASACDAFERMLLQYNVQPNSIPFARYECTDIRNGLYLSCTFGVRPRKTRLNKAYPVNK